MILEGLVCKQKGETIPNILLEWIKGSCRWNKTAFGDVFLLEGKQSNEGEGGGPHMELGTVEWIFGPPPVSLRVKN